MKWKSIISGLLILVTMAVLSSTSLARPPQPAQQVGIIEAVDHAARTLRLRQTGEAGSLTLTWNNRTRFIEHDTAATAAALRKGASVRVWYRSPLFGPRWATKVHLEGGADASTRNPSSSTRRTKP